jgi:glc operon protein GlcG
MKRLSLIVMAAAAFSFATATFAQQPPAPPPSYGMAVTLEQATKIAAAAQAEATKIGQHQAITIINSSGDLIYFALMDGCQYGSIAISQHKARAAAAFRRPTKVFEDRAAAGGIGITVLSLDGVIASAGGLPIIVDGKMIGAVGVSGAPTGTIDEQVAQAGLAALK